MGGHKISGIVFGQFFLRPIILILKEKVKVTKQLLLITVMLSFNIINANAAGSYDVGARSMTELGRNVQEENINRLKNEGNKLDQNHSTTRIDSDTQKYVFISFSMPDGALLELIKQAKIEKFTPIMRGFKEGSYKKTAEALQQIISETNYGVVIDPEVFKEFDVKVVPTFVHAVEKAKPCLANTTCFARKHYKLSGNVTAKYASEKLLRAEEDKK